MILTVISFVAIFALSLLAGVVANHISKCLDKSDEYAKPPRSLPAVGVFCDDSQ
ncbi:hypothetical protein [Staphylococcus intermedius]|uniref:Uncharacterized protein n=1 Tax=Staphylococcus intermedius NCTC 11048 TaxID=1141106 RepID=A0A380G5M8_STAIN|nr:hypothetical protein [Staphylococcus intermedius]SUM45281.1 Uncharacterised protein [Staphylococcus intermedius NCTC 11048]